MFILRTGLDTKMCSLITRSHSLLLRVVERSVFDFTFSRAKVCHNATSADVAFAAEAVAVASVAVASSAGLRAGLVGRVRVCLRRRNHSTRCVKFRGASNRR